MVKDRKSHKPRLPTRSPLPELDNIDAAWDDEMRVPSELELELDMPGDEDAFERVTQVPDLPQDVFAKQLMADADEPPTKRDPATGVSDDQLPPVLGGATKPREVPKPLATEEDVPLRNPSVPRSRLLTGELKLELDDLSGPGSALDLAQSAAPAPERPSSLELSVESLRPGKPPSQSKSDIDNMKDRYAMGDFTGALIVAESILENSPGDIEADRCAQSCREVLTQMYTARLGRLDQTVRVVIPTDQIRWLSLDHRAGFLLSLVDGSLSLDEILDICGMSRLDALRIMYTLHDQRVIALGDPSR